MTAIETSFNLIFLFVYLLFFPDVWQLVSMVTSLSSEQEVQCSITNSAVGFSSFEEIFPGPFSIFCPVLSLEEAPAL